MSDELIEQRVDCPRCRYRHLILIPRGEDWRVEELCPACEFRHGYTFADTRDLLGPNPNKRDPGPKERKEAVQRLGEELWRPVNVHRGHPIVALCKKVCNGFFE